MFVNTEIYERLYQGWKTLSKRKTICSIKAVVHESNINSAYVSPSAFKKSVWSDIEYFIKRHKGICGMRSYTNQFFTANGIFDEVNNITGEIETIYVEFFPTHTDFYLVK